MLKKNHVSCCLVAALCAAVPASAQVVYNDVNDVYYQNFDNPSGWAGTTAIEWVDGATVANWHAALYNGTDANTYSAVTVLKPSSYAYTNGTYLYMFRRTDVLTNGSLGSYSLGAAAGSGVYYGVNIQNNTGAVIESFTFGYTGVQWYSYSSAGVQTLAVSYSTDATVLSDGTWTDVSSMTFNTPQAPYSTVNSVSLNGLNPGNRVELSTTVSGLTIAPGDNVWIRWFDTSDTGYDNALSVDDFYFTVAGTPVPEPSAWAAIMGGVTLGFAALRRRRR